MKKSLVMLTLGLGIVAFGAISFFVGKQSMRLVKEYYARHSEYQPIPYAQVKEEKSFVILVTAQNVEKDIERSLRSVLDQDYTNYRMIFIDNGSHDRTYYRANEWIRRYNRASSTTFVRHAQPKSLTELLYFTIQELANEEIVLLLNGKDWLSHTAVLSQLNRYYNDERVWLTYAQYSMFPQYERGDARSSVIKTSNQVALRASPWIYSEYCTFYAGLFKRIKMRDLLYEGRFFRYPSHRAILMPMLEMSEEHAVFIPEILYINNQEHPVKHTQEEVQCIRDYSRYIRSLHSYNKLSSPPNASFSEQREADLFIFSTDRPMQLFSFLETERKYAHNIHDIYVIYSTSDDKYDDGYQLVKRHFPEICFIKHEAGKQQLKNQVLSLLKKATSAHIAIAEDQLLLKDRLEMGRAISLLEKTGAYGFYFSLGMNLRETPRHYYQLGDEMVAWQFSEGSDWWNQSNSMGMTLYRKEDVHDTMVCLQFHSIPELKRSLSETRNTGELGVCFRESRSFVNLFEAFRPRRGQKEEIYTPEELNQFFLNGMKLDVQQAHRLKNHDPKVELIPTFIER